MKTSSIIATYLSIAFTGTSFASARPSECGKQLQIYCQSRFESADGNFSSILKNDTLLSADFCANRVGNAFVMTVAEPKTGLVAGAAVSNLHSNGIYNVKLVHRLASSPMTEDRASAAGEIAMGRRFRVSTDVRADHIFVKDANDTNIGEVFEAERLHTECVIREK